DEIGDEERTVAVPRRCLLLEIAVLEHAGELDHALQLDLTPAAPDVRSPQGGAEVAGLGPQALLAFGQRAHLFGERAVRALALAVERLGLLVERPQRDGDRLQL